jgi:protein-disulfide isomerase
MSSPSSPSDQSEASNSSATASADARPWWRSSVVAPLAVLAVVGALAIVTVAGPSDGPGAAGGPDGAQPSDAPPIDPEDFEEARRALDSLATREPGDPRALGSADAPIVMIEWADFLCPFCGVFARDTEPELIARYVDEGLLRIEWRDLPFQGEQAVLAAIGGQAAAQQDAFWEYHEAMFAANLRSAENRVDDAFLLDVASDLGLDVSRFASDLADPVLFERVRSDAELGQALGISGTPAFIIGGYPLIGAQPIESFHQVIAVAADDAGVELPEGVGLP